MNEEIEYIEVFRKQIETCSTTDSLLSILNNNLEWIYKSYCLHEAGSIKNSNIYIDYIIETKKGEFFVHKDKNTESNYLIYIRYSVVECEPSMFKICEHLFSSRIISLYSTTGWRSGQALCITCNETFNKKLFLYGKLAGNY